MKFKTYKNYQGRVIYGNNGQPHGQGYNEVQIRKLELNNYQITITDGFKCLKQVEHIRTLELAKIAVRIMINNN